MVCRLRVFNPDLTMEPGFPIGIRSSQEILRVATQSNLSSFHHVGTSTGPVTMSIENILDPKLAQKYSTTQVPKKYVKEHKISHMCPKDFIISISNTLIGLETVPDDWYGIGHSLGLFSDQLHPDKNMVLRIVLDTVRIHQIGFRCLKELSKKIFPNFQVAYSPFFVGVIDIYLEDTLDLVTCIKCLENPLNNIYGITHINYLDNKAILQGSNIREICELDSRIVPEIYSNHIYDIYKNFGIEAVRNVIHQEISKVYQGKKIYIDMISDFMTWYGKISPFVKNNPIFLEQNILAAMSFERARDNIRNLFKYNHDDLTSVYSSIIVGKRISLGTGSNDFKLLNDRKF